MTLCSFLVSEYDTACTLPTSTGVTEGLSSVKMVIKRILTKIVTDEILRLVYANQDALGCEGCEMFWGTQDEHQCLFFGVSPASNLYDYVDEWYSDAASCVKPDKVIDIFDAVNISLNVTESSEDGQNIDKHVVIKEVLDEWREDPDDIARSFYSTFFNNLTELIDSTMQQLDA